MPRKTSLAIEDACSQFFTRKKRFALIIQIAVMIVSIAALCLTSLVYINDYQIDLQVYRFAGNNLLHGDSPYARDLVIHPFRNLHLVFTYPPFAAVFLSPLALIPFGLAKVVTVVLSVVCIAFIVTTCIRHVFKQTSDCSYAFFATRWWWWAAVAVAVVSDPFRSTLGFGQVNVYLAALIVLDVMYLRHTRWHGVLIGIAAAIKLTPAIFILYLLVTKRYKPALVATATAAVATVFTYLPAPADTIGYWTKWIFDTTRVGAADYVRNQAISAIFARLPIELPIVSVAKLALVAAVAVAGFYCVRLLSQHNYELSAMSITALIGLLVSPISWNHHWVWWICIAFSLIQLTDLFSTNTQLWWLYGLALGWIVICESTIIWAVSHDHAKLTPWPLQDHFTGGAYCEVGLVTIAVVTIFAIKKHRQTNSHPDMISDHGVSAGS